MSGIPSNPSYVQLSVSIDQAENLWYRDINGNMAPLTVPPPAVLAAAVAAAFATPPALGSTTPAVVDATNLNVSGNAVVDGTLTVLGGINNSAGVLSTGAITTSGQMVSNYASAAPQLILNNTNSYQYMIEPQQSGTGRGYWGADATYCFRVANAAGTLATLLLDNSGNLTVPGNIGAASLTIGGGTLTNPSGTFIFSEPLATAGAASATNGFIGRTTAPLAGTIGELISSNATVTIGASGTPQNITSISLSAGVWDVQGFATYVTTVAGSNQYNLSVNTVSATQAAAPNVGFNQVPSTATSGFVQAPVQPLTLATATTVYLVGYAGYGSGTVTANGTIRARRVA